MNGNQLFIYLLWRLKHLPEAAVLWVLLKEWGDEYEYKTSGIRMAEDQLPDTIQIKAAQRAIRSLETKGLIKVRIHKKTATRITVNREAVLDLLESGDEFDQRLPGLSQHEFPFLKAWTERHQAKTETDAAIAAATDTSLIQTATPNVPQEPPDPTT